MMFSTQRWFYWASLFMPKERSDWLAAMELELNEISTPAAQKYFAIGCFKTAIKEGAQSRKGLSYIARFGAAACLLSLSCAGIYSAGKMAVDTQFLVVSQIIAALCVLYIGGAALLISSLRGLRVYAGLGFCLATIGWFYFQMVRPKYDQLPIEFLTAVNFEVAGLMAGLFLFTLFLSCLYNPEIHDA